MKKISSTPCRGRLIAAHRRFIGPSPGEARADESAVGCDQSAPTLDLANPFSLVHFLKLTPIGYPGGRGLQTNASEIVPVALRTGLRAAHTRENILLYDDPAGVGMGAQPRCYRRERDNALA